MTLKGGIRRIRWRKVLAIATLTGMLLMNGIAWMQAWAMTHYVSAGERTPKPEALSLGEKIGAVLTGVKVTRPENSSTPSNAGLQYEVYSISAGENEQLEAWYVPVARSHVLVLMFPGYAESKESLLPAARAVHEMGEDVLLVDFRGVGGASGRDTTLGVREGKDVQLAVAYAQRTSPDRMTVLYGISMGSVAIMRAIARERVEPSGTILESPFDSMLSTVGNRFHSMGLPAFPGAELLVFWGSVQQGLNGFAHNPVEYATSMKCPTLLLHGENDPRVTSGQTKSIFDRLSGQKELVSFPGAGHDALVVTAPEMWKKHVGQFLDLVEGR